MKEKINISNSEMKIMNKIWALETMVTVSDMVTILNENGEEWAYQTVATFLKRLEMKKVLSSTKKGRKLFYFPLISKKQYERNAAQEFVDNKFHGSLKNFLVAFSNGDTLNDEEIKDLKEWLNEFDD